MAVMMSLLILCVKSNHKFADKGLMPVKLVLVRSFQKVVININSEF